MLLLHLLLMGKDKITSWNPSTVHLKKTGILKDVETSSCHKDQDMMQDKGLAVTLVFVIKRLWQPLPGSIWRWLGN
jgi:hypothetical protein